MARILGLIVALGVALVIGVAVWRSVRSSAPAQAQATVGSPSVVGQVLVRNDGPNCRGSVAFDDAAQRNAASEMSLQWAPFGRAEVGWATYAPLVAHEVGAGCSPASAEFAEALAGWQQAHGQKPTGVLTPEQFEIMRVAWLRRRPRLVVEAKRVCPEPPPLSALATADPDESYGGKVIQLRPETLSAYRAMVSAARREVPGLKDQPQMLQIFSGFRAPEADAARCAAVDGCDNITRARSCSPHRTGLALDMVMGQAPGYGVDSSADPNRLFMSQTETYHWMVANAGRFGFVNYPFEPWHWEWTGSGPVGTEASQ